MTKNRGWSWFPLLAIAFLAWASCQGETTRSTSANPPEKDSSMTTPDTKGKEVWGDPVQGLASRIHSPQSAYPLNATSIPVHYEIRNVGQENIEVWHSGFWPNNLILLFDEDGQEVPRTAAGAMNAAVFGTEERGKNFPVLLAPGETDSAYEAIDLKTQFQLNEAGTYTVRYVYQEQQGKWQGTLSSNSLTLTLTTP